MSHTKMLPVTKRNTSGRRAQSKPSKRRLGIASSSAKAGLRQRTAPANAIATDIFAVFERDPAELGDILTKSFHEAKRKAIAGNRTSRT